MNDLHLNKTSKTPELAATDQAKTPRRRQPWGLYVLCVMAALGITFAIVWDQYLNERLFPRGFAVTEQDGIYRSGQINRFIIRDVLRDYEIDVVLFMSNDKANRPDVQEEALACREMGIARYNHPLRGDGTGDVQQYVEALSTLIKARQEGKRVLVHCHTGAQRTGGMIAFYRVLAKGWSGQQAYLEMLANNHDPFDNTKMIPYLNANMRTVAEQLHERGLIERVPDPLPVIGP